MEKYYPPKFQASNFHCPHCGVYAQQSWHIVGCVHSSIDSIDDREYYSIGKIIEDWNAAVCAHCEKFMLWAGEKMLIPTGGTAPMPHADMPEDIKVDFEEAREIIASSPRGAAALLRLAVEKLCRHLTGNKNKLDTLIGELVKKGLPDKIQQALDSVRVIGNEAVHPGTIDLKDTPETAQSLFELVNLIVEVMISQPQKVNQIYQNLPDQKLKAIEDRDQ